MLTGILAAAFHRAQLPAAFLIGSLLAAIILAARGRNLRLPSLPTLLAQAVVGCMIAGVLSASIFVEFERHWPLFVGATVIPILAAALCGWTLSRLRVLPSSTGVWGAMPGAAMVMVLMGESFGADVRLVAFMQYLRVLCVAIVASLVGLALGHHGLARPAIDWFPRLHAIPFGTTLAIVAVGIGVGSRTRLPAGALLVPMVLAAGLHLGGIVEVQVPQWLLVAAYVILGWNIGLKFTVDSLRYAWRSLPAILSSILVLMLFCAGLAGVLAGLLQVDFLTTYLATSPGGADSVAIIAASTPVDVPMVMALQVSRFLLVMLAGPPLAKAVARTLPSV